MAQKNFTKLQLKGFAHIQDNWRERNRYKRESGIFIICNSRNIFSLFIFLLRCARPWPGCHWYQNQVENMEFHTRWSTTGYRITLPNKRPLCRKDPFNFGQNFGKEVSHTTGQIVFSAMLGLPYFPMHKIPPSIFRQNFWKEVYCLQCILVLLSVYETPYL